MESRKKLATIQGKDYWNMHSWGVDFRPDGRTPGVSAYYSNHDYSNESRRVKRNMNILLTLNLIIPITCTWVTLFLVQDNEAIFSSSAILSVSSSIAILTILLGTILGFYKYIISHPTLLHERKNVSERFPLKNVTLDQCHEIVNELNILKEDGQFTDYMNIVHQIVVPVFEDRKKIESESQDRKLVEISKNPYLNGRVIKNYPLPLDAFKETLDKLNDVLEDDKICSELDNLKNEANRLQDDGRELTRYQIKALNNCQDELVQASKIFNSLKKTNTKPTCEMITAYEKLIATCLRVIETIRDDVMKAEEQAAIDSINISNIFLKEKYSIID